MGEKDMTISDVKAALRGAAVAMQAKHVKEVRDLDAEIGDGDLGITVQKGFKAVEGFLDTAEASDLSFLLRQIGVEFSEANPSTFSAFFATAFRKAAVTVKEKESIGAEDVCAMFEAAMNGVVKLGKAQAGDKTLLDALIPAVEAVCSGAKNNDDVHALLSDAADAAEAGMKSTVGMISKMGRARSFGERTRDVRDPGATVVYLFLREIVNTLTGQQV
jgi:dihydroxyacetone kinase-like protein